MRLFYDTNVVIDVMANRQPFYEASAKTWGFSELRKAQGMVSAVSFTTLHYILRKQTTRAVAIDALRSIRNVVEFIACDAAILNQAIDSGLDDFEDAVQYFSAVAGRADYLITRNVKHFPSNGLRIVSPEEFLIARAIK